MFQRKADIMLLRGISQSCNSFVSRSANYLPYKSKVRMELAADMAFYDSFAEQSDTEKVNGLIVVALANIFSGNTDEYRSIFENKLVKFFQYILKRGYKINFVPFKNEIDKSLQDRICQKINDANAVSLPFHENPYDTFNEILKGEFCIGMRFHSLVMSFMNNTPCLSISYSDKNEDIMERLGQSEYSLRFGINNHEYFNEEIMIDGDILINKFKKMVNNKCLIQNKIKDTIPEMKQLSKINYDKLINI